MSLTFSPMLIAAGPACGPRDRIVWIVFCREIKSSAFCVVANGEVHFTDTERPSILNFGINPFF